MDRLSLTAWLGIGIVAVSAVGALGTLGRYTLGTGQAIATVAVVVLFVGASVLLGRRGAGPRTPYW